MGRKGIFYYNEFLVFFYKRSRTIKMPARQTFSASTFYSYNEAIFFIDEQRN